MSAEESVMVPKWYLKALLIFVALQVLLSLGSLALNLWINFKINRLLWNEPLID